MQRKIQLVGRHTGEPLVATITVDITGSDFFSDATNPQINQSFTGITEGEYELYVDEIQDEIMDMQAIMCAEQLEKEEG